MHEGVNCNSRLVFTGSITQLGILVSFSTSNSLPPFPVADGGIGGIGSGIGNDCDWIDAGHDCPSFRLSFPPCLGGTPSGGMGCNVDSPSRFLSTRPCFGISGIFLYP